MTKQTYHILSGDVFKVEAVSREQALAMFYVSQGVATPEQAAKDFDVLDFTLDDTFAVEFVETATQIIE